MKNYVLTFLASLMVLISFGQGQFQKECSGSLTFTSGRVMQLAEAIPEDNYKWAPGEGIRSVSGVLGHIISANYFFAMKLGAQIPADVNMQTVEQDLKTKADYKAALKKSYDLIIGVIGSMDDSVLSNKVEFPFPGEYTSMTAAIIGLTHTNEHLGQLIAYARSNGIAPPWSE